MGTIFARIPAGFGRGPGLTSHAEGANDGRLRHARKWVLDFLRNLEKGTTLLKRNPWKRPGVLAVVAAAAVIGSLLAFTTVGRAASPNICNTSSTATTNASCVDQTVAPHVLTANEDAVSITRFTNQSGVGGATATHVVLRATFPSPVTVTGVLLFVNGAQVFSNPCTPASLPSGPSAQSVSCSVGSIAGTGNAKMIVRFKTAQAMTVTGAATYGESGNDSLPPRPNGTTNDTQQSRDSFIIASAGTAQGDCFDANQFVGGLASVSGATTTQSTAASLGQASTSLNLPCSPASAGIDTDPTHRPASFTRPVSFAEFMQIAGNAFGTVTIDFLTSVPNGLVLKELLAGTDPTVASNWLAVPNCVSGLPPSGDSCIFSRKNLPKGGLELILHVLGSSIDPRYIG
jgi:hypothetical protein